MNQVLAYVFGYGTPALVFLAVAMLPVIGMALAVSRPTWVVLGYIVILMCFTQTSYGALEADRTIYSRGSGQLFFSFLHWTLLGLALTLPFLARWSGNKPIRTNLGIPFLLLAMLFVGNLMVAPLLNVDIAKVFASNGFINLLFMGLIVFVIVRSVNSRLYLGWLEKTLLTVGAARAVFGLGRYAAFGGDSSNVYENVEHLGFKITYFDICDSMIASVVLIYCLRRLFANWQSMKVAHRLALLLLVAMELALTMLSYRRTAWGGLILALFFFACLLPSRQRILTFLAAPLIAFPIWLLGSQRLGQVTSGQSFFGQFFYDLNSKNNFVAESTRSIELKASFQTFLDNPLFGTGAWGRYRGANGIAWQVGPDAFTFVHSGVLHILLKTGLAGMAIALAAVFQFVRFLIRARKDVAEKDRWLFDASVAGLIFMIPDFMLGTPIPQFRTMLLYGVMIAIPYVIAGLSARELLGKLR